MREMSVTEQSRAELLRVPGVGDSKLRKYGEEVLEILSAK